MNLEYNRPFAAIHIDKLHGAAAQAKTCQRGWLP